MSPMKTLCPTWCETDHNCERGHAHFLGEYEHVQVRAYVWATVPEPVIQLTNLRPLRRDATSITDIEVGEASGLAALMDTLGHREIAELIRDAVELIEDELELAPVQVEGGAR